VSGERGASSDTGRRSPARDGFIVASPGIRGA
jgi:hypothetical protein